MCFMSGTSSRYVRVILGKKLIELHGGGEGDLGINTNDHVFAAMSLLSLDA